MDIDVFDDVEVYDRKQAVVIKGWILTKTAAFVTITYKQDNQLFDIANVPLKRPLTNTYIDHGQYLIIFK